MLKIYLGFLTGFAGLCLEVGFSIFLVLPGLLHVLVRPFAPAWAHALRWSTFLVIHGLCRILHGWLRFAHGTETRIHGQRHLRPGHRQIIAVKHQGIPDNWLVWRACGTPGVVAKGRGVRGAAVGLIGGGTVSGLWSGTGAVKRLARSAGCASQSILIFPEGAHAAPGDRKRTRNGAGLLYKALEAEIVPVGSSLGVLYRSKTPLIIHSGRIGTLEFGSPITPGLHWEMALKRLERDIETRTRDLLVRDAPEGERDAILQRWNEADRAFRSRTR